MDISVAQLPSGGYGYKFPTIRIEPLDFLGLTKYVEGVPQDDSLGKYQYDIRLLVEDDPNIKDCYIMDVDFLIFYKKLCTISDDLSYQVEINCPDCGKKLKKTIYFDKDIHFRGLDERVMNGAQVELGGHTYQTIIPTVTDFMKVFQIYMKYKKITDLKMIKTIALFKDFSLNANQIEKDVLGAKHEDITVLLMLQDLYFDLVEPIQMFCPDCNKGLKPEERRSVAVSIDSLIVNLFRDLYINCPVDGSKILFK